MITRKNSRSRVAIAVAACVAAVASTSAHADALAQSLLDITSFKISFTAGEITPQCTPTATVQSSATFNNVAGTPVLAGLQTVTSVGPNAALYTAASAMTPYSGAVLPGNFSGGFAEQLGNALAPSGADAHSDATVSIVPQGAPFNGSQGSNTVGQEFLVNVGGPGKAAVAITFDADAFLRAYLSSGPFFDFQSGGANASTTWRLEIFRVISPTSQPQVAAWNPGGGLFTPGWGCDGVYVSGCSEVAPFQLNQNIVAFGDNDDLQFDNSGAFSGAFSLLGSTTYRFSINHTSIANANLNLRAIPEPGSLALVGLALLAAGVSARRRLG